MIDYMKNTLIGLFVVVACGLIVGIILFLEPSVGDGKETLIVRFSNINGISIGTRVMFAGKPVGEVARIEQIPHAREQPTDELGQVYFYQLVLHVDSSVRIYNTDEVAVQTSGLLGEKSIAIIPRVPPRGIKPTLITSKMPIYADSIDPLESAFNEVSQLSDKIEETLDKVIAWIDQNGHELGASIRAFDDAMTEASMALGTINQTHLIETLKMTVESFHMTMKEMGYILDQMIEDKTFTNLSLMVDHMKNASVSIDKMTDFMRHGKGTFGRFLMEDGTYLRINSILSKANTLMNDVNHYGLLFNLNKQWQRTRLKQVNELNALKTPQNFCTYFNKEVDLINTSMSRLSMLIERTQECDDSETVFENSAFREGFSNLLRSTEALYDNLRLYNEQLQNISPSCP